jgi:hypothetical protein
MCNLLIPELALKTEWLDRLSYDLIKPIARVWPGAAIPAGCSIAFEFYQGRFGID